MTEQQETTDTVLQGRDRLLMLLQKMIQDRRLREEAEGRREKQQEEAEARREKQREEQRAEERRLREEQRAEERRLREEQLAEERRFRAEQLAEERRLWEEAEARWNKVTQRRITILRGLVEGMLRQREAAIAKGEPAPIEDVMVVTRAQTKQ